MPLRHDNDCSTGESSGGSFSSGSRQTSSSYFSLSSSPFTQSIKTTNPASLSPFASPSSPGTELNLETHYASASSSSSSSSSPSANTDPTNPGQDPETTILAQEPQNEEPEAELEPYLASSRTSLQRSYRKVMAEYSEDKIEEVYSQIESERSSAEAEEEELARMMATRCLADEIHTVDINGQQMNRDNLLEVNVNAVPYSARAVRQSNEGDVAMIKLESMFVNPVVHGSTSASTAANSSSASTGNSSSTPIPSGSILTPSEKQNQNENEPEYKNNPPISKLSQLRHQYPHHFQMCEYYTAAATCAERLSRSNVTITSHSQLLSNVIRARTDEAKASLNQQKRQEKEEKNREKERVREEEKERERVQQIKEKWVADVMRLGHQCVWKRGILQDVHKEAWGLERQEDDEREKEEKMERVRVALVRARAKAQAAAKSDPSRARHSRPSSATVISEKSTRERSTQAPKESTAPKQDDIPTGEHNKRSMLDRVRSWRSGDEREKERERKRLERGRRSHEKLEMWERKWLEAHPGYVSDWDYEGDERREGDGDGDGDGDEWLAGSGMWEGF